MPRIWDDAEFETMLRRIEDLEARVAALDEAKAAVERMAGPGLP